MKKVLFILKKRMSYGSYNFYGVSYGLINSAKFVAKELNKLPRVEAKVIEVDDNNCIDREVALFKPDVVIIEALWVVPEKMKVLIKLHPKVEWIIRLHSKPAFIANEGIAFDWIGKYIEIGKQTEKLQISANNKEFADYLTDLYKEDVSYTPNIYPDVWRFNPRKPVGEFIDIGCFGSLRPMKNHLTQAIAAIAFARSIGKKLRFHINFDRVEQKGDTVLKNLRELFKDIAHAELVEHSWMDHKDFINLVKTMDLGAQVSLSETYNIIGADFISCGIPVLVCKEIEFAPSLYVADPSSLESIEKGLMRLYTLDNPLLTTWAKIGLSKFNDKAIADWKIFLKHH